MPKDISLKLSWGFPLMRNSHEEPNHRGRFHFELSVSPDFDALVKLRKPKNVEKVKIDNKLKIAENNKKEEKSTPKKQTVIKSLNNITNQRQQS